MAKKSHIERLKQVIFHLHKARATHAGSVPTGKKFFGKTIWKGDVEIFNLIGHPKATICYAWTYGEPEEFITILEMPPITDVKSAVKVGLAYQIKKAGVK